MTELEWLKKIYPYLGKSFKNEDCAVIKTGHKYFLFTTDALVEGVHFHLSYFNYYNIGYKLGAINLSDIAAGGGTPLWALLNLGTKEISEKTIEFFEGLYTCLKNAGAQIIGGDTVKSSVFFCSLTLIGETKYPLLRKGAKVGDLIFVSKPLGESAAFLRFIKEKDLNEIPENLKTAHLKPIPEIELGKRLSELKIPSSCIDISDGLVLDLSRICEENGLGAVLWQEKIPIGAEATFEEALYGGEDYALLFTVPKENVDKLKKLEKMLKKELFCIGQLIKENKIYLEEGGKFVPLKKQGFDHFAK